LNVVPSINNDAHLYQDFTTLAHIDNHLYHFCDICTTFKTLFAKLVHFAALKAIDPPRKIAAIATHHIHPVTTATATVITISVKISHASFAFSSLRFQNQYHLISL
jgi:hypothetical protein